MASIILGTVGSLLGPVGGAIGAAVGGYLDRAFIFPALIPEQVIEGPRVNELQIQGSDEGQPANFIVGGEARVAGTIIWITDIQETQHTSTQGGKGGGGQKTRSYTYSVDMAIAIAMQDNITLRKILAEGREVYDSDPNVSLSGVVTATIKGLYSYKSSRMRLSSPAGGPDLSTLVIGYDCVVSGYSNGSNNGTFKVVSSSRDRATGASTALLKNNFCVTETPAGAVSLTQTIPTYDTDKVTNIAFYPGSTSQTPDSEIEAYEGAGNVPGFISTCYIRLKGFQLGQYGNRIPQFSIVADAGGATVAEAITACWERSGRTAASDIDVTGISGEMKGYAVTGPFSPINALQPLALAYDVLSQEGDAKVRFFHRKNATIIEVDERDLAAHEYGSDTARPLTIEEEPSSESPSEANIKYVDLEAESQAGSQRERRIDYQSDGVLNINLPIALTGAVARGIARRLLWVAWANKKTFTLSLPARYFHIQENDCLRVKALGSPWLFLVQKADVGLNGVIEVEAVLENRDVLTQEEVADAPYGNTTALAGGPIDTETTTIEIPPWVPTTTRVPGAPTTTHGAVVETDELNFPGCQVFESDDDDEYYPWLFLTQGATLGAAETVLAGTGVNPAYWDRVSTVTVRLFNLAGTLESKPEIDVLNGANRAMVGGEIIGFATATLVDDNTYTLSDLLRGLRDTADQMTSHALGEDFGFLDGAVKEQSFPLSWIGSTHYFKYVFAGQNLADATAQSLTINGDSLRPFSPGGLGVTKDASGQVTGTITRRTRVLTRIFSPALTPLHEQEEKYEIDVIYPAGGSTVVRTITVTDTNVFSYGEANQTTDGVTAFDPIKYQIYQISEIYGRGKALTVTA